MKVAGIVCEFNPFHTGHERILSYCKEELGADAVICCMSGNFVQRGEPAVMDKYTRALTAIGRSKEASAAFNSGEALAPARASADLVIELPAIGATANAETFARTGVNTLLATGIVTDVVFGSESGNEEAIEKAARLLLAEPPAFKAALGKGLKKGLSYPAAMAKAAVSCGADSFVFENPNDLLGVLYVKAILEYKKIHPGLEISFHAVKRESTGHDKTPDKEASYTSSSAIRQALQTDAADGQTSSDGQISKSPTERTAFEDQLSFLPSASYDALNAAADENALVFPDDFSLLLHEKLYSFPDLTAVSDIDSDLKNRVLKNREAFTSLSSFAEILDTRNYTRARCRRALLHIVLGITDDATTALARCGYSPYIHVLAMNDTGSKLLGKRKASSSPSVTPPAETDGKTIPCDGPAVPVFCALSEPAAKELSPDASAVLQKDIFANDIYNIILTNKNGKPRIREASRKVLKV